MIFAVSDLLPLTACINCSFFFFTYINNDNQAESEYKYLLTFRVCVCCHSNEALIANPTNSAELDGTPTIPPSYIWVCAVV